MNGDTTFPGITVADDAAVETGVAMLEAGFPICRKLAGDAHFRSMARAFADATLISPAIVQGDGFGDFIASFRPARSLPYLGDLARLEAARARAGAAAGALPLSVAALASAPCVWRQMRVALHPSIQIITSAHPIVSIWEASADPESINGLPPEDALVARPDLAVEIRRLPPGGAEFLSNLSRHATVREAAFAAAAGDPRFDLVTSLSVLLVSRIFVGFSCPDGRPPRVDDGARRPRPSGKSGSRFR